MPNTTVNEKTIKAKRIKPHSDRVGMVATPDEQNAGAVPALKLVNVQAVAENEAVSCTGSPLDGIVTPVNV